MRLHCNLPARAGPLRTHARHRSSHFPLAMAGTCRFLDDPGRGRQSPLDQRLVPGRRVLKPATLAAGQPMRINMVFQNAMLIVIPVIFSEPLLAIPGLRRGNDPPARILIRLISSHPYRLARKVGGDLTLTRSVRRPAWSRSTRCRRKAAATPSPQFCIRPVAN